ncbi:MAG: class I SAM-dependent methyltransferase [Candidatus Brocadiia bacterium]
MKLLKQLVRRRLRRFLGLDEFEHLDRAVIDLADVGQLRRAFGWTEQGVVDDPWFRQYRFLTDINDRPMRDAEVLATVVRNAEPGTCLEIGTAAGHGTALIAQNAPEATVHTVNIPPEEFDAGGELTTVKMSRDEIGAYYREQGLSNIRQIYANTADWAPDFGPIDVAFIDGCHDADFVYNDTRKVLERCGPGSFILWHDFAPDLVRRYDWVHSVCTGVERLFRDGLLDGRVLHVRDSWVGVHRIPEEH